MELIIGWNVVSLLACVFLYCASSLRGPMDDPEWDKP